MGVIIYVGLVLGLGYLGILLWLVWRWKSVKEQRVSADYQSVTSISVLVAAKNEAHNIEALTSSLLAQNYPKGLVEFILIDDHSTDGTNEQFKALSFPDNFSIINSKEEPGKKNALTQGVKQAKNSVIVTTDADCLPSPNWLRSIAYLMEKEQPQFIAGPVQFHQEQSLFERFQSLDFLGMMLITGVGIDSHSFFMANGANMAFQKSAFEVVHGYEGNEHIASGDDMFLIHKISTHFPKGSIVFNKSIEAIVSTKAEPTLKGFIHQRVRWGGKNKASQDVLLKMILAWVMLTAIWLIVFPFVRYWWMVLVLKLVGDFVLLSAATRYFGRKSLMRSFLPSFLLHTIYVGLIGFLSLLWVGKWK